MGTARRALFVARRTTGQPMKVLFRTRHHAPTDGGGDYLQLQRTLGPLQRLGVETTVSNDPQPGPDTVRRGAFVWFGRSAQRPAPCEPGTRVWQADCNHAHLLAARCPHRGGARQPARYPEFALDTLTPEAQNRIRQIQTLEEDLYQLSNRVVLDLAESVLPQSAAEGALLSETFGVPTHKLHVAPNAADTSYATGSAERFFQEYGLRDFVLCIALFQDHKNQMNLIRGGATNRRRWCWSVIRRTWATWSGASERQARRHFSRSVFSHANCRRVRGCQSSRVAKLVRGRRHGGTGSGARGL